MNQGGYQKLQKDIIWMLEAIDYERLRSEQEDPEDPIIVIEDKELFVSPRGSETHRTPRKQRKLLERLAREDAIDIKHLASQKPNKEALKKYNNGEEAEIILKPVTGSFWEVYKNWKINDDEESKKNKTELSFDEKSGVLSVNGKEIKFRKGYRPYDILKFVFNSSSGDKWDLKDAYEKHEPNDFNIKGKGKCRKIRESLYQINRRVAENTQVERLFTFDKINFEMDV